MLYHLSTWKQVFDLSGSQATLVTVDSRNTSNRRISLVREY